MQTLFKIIASLAVAYLVIVMLMYFMQSQMVYHPQKEIVVTPSSAGLEYEDVNFKTEDGIRLHGWFVPVEESQLTILYFHGNAGNISGRMGTIQLLHRLGLNVFIFDYRGYGQSEGSPNEEGTQKDATAAWSYLRDERGISEEDIIIMGRSLGGAVASELAVRRNPGAVIIESTFTSAADLGADIYPWLPVRWILKYDYNTLQNIKEIDAPLFMAHSRADQVVPFEHGKQLFDSAKAPKTFLELRGSHGMGYQETGAEYRDSLRDFLRKHLNYD